MASPTPRSKFLFMHLADPNKAAIKGPGRRNTEVAHMLRRPGGQEDFNDDDDSHEADIDPVLRNILGIGGGGGGGSSGAAQHHQHAMAPVEEEDDEDDSEAEDDEEEDDDEEEEEVRFSRKSVKGGKSKKGRRTKHRKHSSKPQGTHLNLPPRGAAPLRSHSQGGRYISHLMQDTRSSATSSSSSSSASTTSSGSSASRSSGLEVELNRRILEAAGLFAKPIKSGAGGGGIGIGIGGGTGAGSAIPQRAMLYESYAHRRQSLKEERERKIEKRMMDMVHKGTMPPELLLDEELAKGSKMDADNFEDDPDAYDTDELLGSDVETIPSTDEDEDEMEAVRRDRMRAKRRSQKVRVLRRRKREAWAKKRKDIELAKSRYYDDMIDQLVQDNPSLRPPTVNDDLETKRAFVDRATAENMTRSKIENMTRWIRLVSVVVENLGMITGFLMLDGLSVAIDQELRKPEMQPIIAQLARKYLRRGPSSPEWALAIMFLGSVGTIHAANVRVHETQMASSGKGAATGPGSSKLGKVVSGVSKIMKAVGIFGGGGGAGPAIPATAPQASVSPPPKPAPTVRIPPPPSAAPSTAAASVRTDAPPWED